MIFTLFVAPRLETFPPFGCAVHSPQDRPWKEKTPACIIKDGLYRTDTGLLITSLQVSIFAASHDPDLPPLRSFLDTMAGELQLYVVDALDVRSTARVRVTRKQVTITPPPCLLYATFVRWPQALILVHKQRASASSSVRIRQRDQLARFPNSLHRDDRGLLPTRIGWRGSEEYENLNISFFFSLWRDVGAGFSYRKFSLGGVFGGFFFFGSKNTKKKKNNPQKKKTHKKKPPPHNQKTTQKNKNQTTPPTTSTNKPQH